MINTFTRRDNGLHIMSEAAALETGDPPPKKREDKRRVTTSPNDALQNDSDSDTTIPLAFNPSKRAKSLSKHSLELDTSDEEEDDEDINIKVPSQKRKAVLFSDDFFVYVLLFLLFHCRFFGLLCCCFA